MKVLIIGSGGREHALAWKFAHEGHSVLVAPGNDGMRSVAEVVPISAMDFAALIRLAQARRVDFTVVGPDEPLAHGIVDAFTVVGLPIFGPTKRASIIEWSKAEAKSLMHIAKVPTAQTVVYKNADIAREALCSVQYPLYLKASGLARGKGAYYCASYEQAQEALERIAAIKETTDRRIAIEDVLEGEEASLHALVDGYQVPQFQLFPLARDHKRLYTGNVGPNTGGMGAYAPVKEISERRIVEIASRSIGDMLLTIAATGVRYTGFMYPGLMLGKMRGFNVLEYNARGGDPEIQVYARLLAEESRLLDALVATSQGQPNRVQLVWKTGYAVSIALVSKDYGTGMTHTEKPITGIREAERMTNVVVFHGATIFRDGHYWTNDGRILHVTACGETLHEARERAYEACALIYFDGMHYRSDIASGGTE